MNPIISGVYTVISGFTTLSGMNYTGLEYDAEYIYSHFPGLKTADILYGAACVGMGVLEINSFHCLLRLRRFQLSFCA